MTLLLDKPIDLTEEKWQLPLGFDPDNKEHAEVIAWREQCFKEMGWADYIAKHLAESAVDLHRMDDMLKRGCDPMLALDIFFGGRT